MKQESGSEIGSESMHEEIVSDEQTPADCVLVSSERTGTSNAAKRMIISNDLSVYSWNNVTDEFRKCASELNLGELLHDVSFSLFEGMSAIELMDPKMDAGMVRANGTAAEAKVNGITIDNLKWCNFEFSELITLMDSTFAALVAWLEGHSLAQTLFTNLYLHKPQMIEDRILKAFTLCVLKLTFVCYDIIRRANVFEEEDFQQMLYNFDLAGDVSESRIVGMVKEAEDDCLKVIRNAKGKDDAETAKKVVESEALLERLRFVRHLLVALIALTVKEDKSLHQQTQGPLPKVQNVDEAKRNFLSCEVFIVKIGETSTLEETLPQEDYNYSSVIGFDPTVNQHLLPPTFPRHTKFLRPGATFEYLLKLIQRLTFICSLQDHLSSFATALDFFRDFSRRENCILSRSVLQLAFFPGGTKVMNRTSFIDLVKEAIRDFIQPPVLNPKYNLANDVQCKALLDEFLNNCCRVLSELMKICGHNRARQRDCYSMVLEDLGNLQEEADRLDAHLHSILNNGAAATAPGRHHLACLGSFVLYHVLKSMIEYLLLGFELELYSTHEYAYIYWYTNEFLFKWLVNVLHKADNFIYEQEQFHLKLEKNKGDKKKSRGKKKTSKSHRLEIMQLQSRQKLCEGYYRAMLGFYASNRIKMPSFANSDEYDAIRYEHRLAPFAHMATPPMISYHQYLEISNFKEIVLKVKPHRLYTDASHCFEEARMGFENIPSSDVLENASLARICKMNAVVLRLLASGHTDDTNDWPRFDFSLHSDFSVFKLK